MGSIFFIFFACFYCIGLDKPLPFLSEVGEGLTLTEGKNMKAIDRAAYWVQALEQAGFDIECETSIDIVRNELVTVWATKGNAKVVFVIQTNTKFTRFMTGATGYVRLGRFTRKPSQMSLWISCELDIERDRINQAVSA